MVESVSTDKLQIVSDMITNMPLDKMTKLKSLTISWDYVVECAVPNLSLSFFS